MIDFNSKTFSMNELTQYLSKHDCIQFTQPKLKAIISNQEALISKIKMIPPAYRSLEEKALFEKVETANKVFNVFMNELSINYTVSLYELLSHIETNHQDENIFNIIKKIQFLAVKNTLDIFKKKLNDETDLLALVYMTPERFTDVIPFASLLIYLINNKYSSSKIINSQILNTFFIQNITNLREIEKTYSLIKAFPSDNDSDKYQLLSEIANYGATGDNSECYENFSLMGELVGKDKLSTVTTLPPVYQWANNLKNLFNVYSLLGPVFIVSALNKCPRKQQHLFLEYVFKNETEHNIGSIFNYVNTKVSTHDGLRYKLVNLLNSYIDEAMMLKLIANNTVSIWTGLNCKSNLYQPHTNSFITQQITQSEIKPHEMRAAYFVACNMNFHFFKNIILIRIYKVCIKKPAINIEPDIINSFKSCLAVQDLIFEKASALLKELNQLIHSKDIDLDEYSIMDIVDYVRAHINTYRLLTKLSIVKLHLPYGNYQRDAHILEQLFIKSKSSLSKIQFQTILNALHPKNKYSAYENAVEIAANAKNNTLLEAIVYSKNIHFKSLLIEYVKAPSFFNDITISNMASVFNSYLDTSENIALKDKSFFITELTRKIRELVIDGRTFQIFIFSLSCSRKDLAMELIKTQYSMIIQSDRDIVNALKYLSFKQKERFLKENLATILNIFKAPSKFKQCLFSLPLSDYSKLFHIIKKHLYVVIKSANTLNYLLNNLYIKKSQLLLDACKHLCPKLYLSNQILNNTLYYLSENQARCFILTNPNIILNNTVTAMDLRALLLNVSLDISIFITAFFKNILSQIIRSGEDLRVVIQSISIETAGFIVSIMKPHMSTIIKTERQLYFSLLGLSVSKSDLIISALSTELMREIIYSRKSFNFISAYQKSMMKNILQRSQSHSLIIAPCLFFSPQYITEQQQLSFHQDSPLQPFFSPPSAQQSIMSQFNR